MHLIGFQILALTGNLARPPGLQRILSSDRQSIMTEVSQIDAAGSTVLGNLLYSDGAVPLLPICIPSPLRGPSVEPLSKHAFFNPTDVGATLTFWLKGIYCYSYEENLQANC
jgi:hypothetical protein